MSNKHKVVFEFDTEEQLDTFVTWMSESGEQQFWVWEEEADYEGTTNFDYWILNNDTFGPNVKCELLKDV